MYFSDMEYMSIYKYLHVFTLCTSRCGSGQDDYWYIWYGLFGAHRPPCCRCEFGVTIRFICLVKSMHIYTNGFFTGRIAACEITCGSVASITYIDLTQFTSFLRGVGGGGI